MPRVSSKLPKPRGLSKESSNTSVLVHYDKDTLDSLPIDNQIVERLNVYLSNDVKFSELPVFFNETELNYLKTNHKQLLSNYQLQSIRINAINQLSNHINNPDSRISLDATKFTLQSLDSNFNNSNQQDTSPKIIIINKIVQE